MPVPVQQKVWTISANNRISYVSLNDLTSNYLKGIADFLLANGYTCKGSSNGAAAAMDGVNRWTTAANAATRGGNTTTAQSWMVLTDGSGCDLCLAYATSIDDGARFSFSPSGVYVAAGTATFTPTATDEQVMVGTATGSATSVVGNNTSLDRIWFGWVDSEAKLCRFYVSRDLVMAAVAWGLEVVNSDVVIPFSPTVWGFCYGAATTGMQWDSSSGVLATYSVNVKGGIAQIDGVSVSINGGAIVFMNTPRLWFNTRPELQKGIGAPMWPMSIASTTSTRQGPVGALYDWWSAPEHVGFLWGSLFPGGTWIMLSLNNATTSGIAWPWDGVTTPETA